MQQRKVTCLKHLLWSLPLKLQANQAFIKSTKIICVPVVHQRELKTSTICHHVMESMDKDLEEKQRKLTVKEENFFDRLAIEKAAKDKKTFIRALQIYEKKHGALKRGHVEFIYAALNKMKEFGVHKDIDVYKAIIDIFPKGKMVPQSVWQVEFMHYPKQQNCCIDILEKMSDNGVLPDDAMGYQLMKIFGNKTHAFRKYRRMMYWMPKFKYANPYYVPWELPNDRIEIAKLAVKRMSVGVDFNIKLQVLQTADVEDSYDDTFIVSSQGREQCELLKNHPIDTPLYVEGGFNVWIRQYCLKYFILRSKITDRYTDFKEKEQFLKDDDTNFSWNFMQEEVPKDKVIIRPSNHEQDDGTVLGICVTGTSSKDSLVSWIKCLEKENPVIEQTPVMFLLKTPESGLKIYDGDKPLYNEIGFYDGS